MINENNNLRVLFYASFFEYKGSETYYTDEVNSVIKSYPNTKFLVFTIGHCKKNRNIKYSKNILWIQRKRLRSFRVLKEMVKIIIKFKPNIIHSVYVVPSIIMGILGRPFKIPTILHGRGTDLNYYPFLSVRSRILAMISGKINNLVITVSKSMRRDCLKLNFPKKKLVYLYDGIDYQKFAPKNKIFYNDNKKRIEILHIGRFSFEKCHSIIIETCRLLDKYKVNFHLTMIGIGPLKDMIVKLIDNFNLKEKITLLGWVNHNDLPKYFVKSDIFILPSLTEGLPISVLEAMSMKLPVILTRVGGMPELANKFGCVLIDKNNKEDLFNAILYYINKPKYIEIGGNINRNFIIKNFDWDLHAKKLFDLYMRLKNNE